ncbi:MAG: hypothetical protein ABI224_01480, partial [Acetobacteraceae bacterium]
GEADWGSTVPPPWWWCALPVGGGDDVAWVWAVCVAWDADEARFVSSWDGMDEAMALMVMDISLRGPPTAPRSIEHSLPVG